MNIKDKAKEYAEGKAMNALTAAIEAAYTEGYNAGFNDGAASKKVEKPKDLEYSVEYVDLGLPSGTKWATDYLEDKSGEILYFPFEKAQTMNIPTKEQYEELLECCNLTPIVSSVNKTIGYSIIAKNGNSVSYYKEGYYAGQKYGCKFPQFWLKGEEQEGDERVTAKLGYNGYESFFMGFKFPIILVKE